MLDSLKDALHVLVKSFKRILVVSIENQLFVNGIHQALNSYLFLFAVNYVSRFNMKTLKKIKNVLSNDSENISD